MKILSQIFLIFLFSLFTARSSAQELDIDWSTYFSEGLTNIAVVRYDPISNCIYIAGHTADTIGIATAGTHKSDIGFLETDDIPILLDNWNTGAFIAKLTLEGELVWGTYYGGVGIEVISDMVIDDAGDIYIVGKTFSDTGIATAGTYMDYKASDTGFLPFLAKFDESGQQVWGTYYGTNLFSENDDLTVAVPITASLAVDAEHNVYVAGVMRDSSIAFATAGAYQMEYGGVRDGYIIKFDATGNRTWSTFFGGAGYELLTAIEVSKNGFLYLSGITESYGLGTDGTYQPENITVGEAGSAFISKFTLDGARVWTTYISSDEAPIFGDVFRLNGYIGLLAMDVDSFDNVYVYGKTTMFENIATAGTHQPVYVGSPGYSDAFMMKFTSAGHRAWGTYYGGNMTETMGNSGNTIGRARIDASADGQSILIVGGSFGSVDGIAFGCGYEGAIAEEGYIAKFDSSGNIFYGSYYDAYVQDATVIPGKNSGDQSDIIIVGRTMIDYLATPGSLKDNKTGYWLSAYITKFEETCPAISFSLLYDYPMLSTAVDFDNYTLFHNGVAVGSNSTGSFDIGSDTSGNYYLEAERCNCNYRSDTISFGILGIELLDQHESWSLYPNPVTDMITLDFGEELNFNTASTLTILDMYGRQVYIREIEKGRHHQLQIPTSSLTAGVYMVAFGNKQMLFSKL